MKNKINNSKKIKIILKYLKILYIEDEELIRKNITKALKLIVGDVYNSDSISQAKNILDNNKVDIIISDINLGLENGLDLIKDIRINYKEIPIIILTAHTDKNYLLKATKLKLVDYLIKPVNFKALYTALEQAVQEIIDNGRYSIDFCNNTSYNVLNKELTCNKTQEVINLTAKEIILLETLIENNVKVLSQETLKNFLWDQYSEITDSALKNLINKLRKKIGKESIKNISGVGYRLQLIKTKEEV